MKLVVLKNYLVGQILYKSLGSSKKRRPSDIFIEPDWLAIGMLLLFGILLLLLLTVLMMLFRKYGWTKLLYENPFYRALNRLVNMDMFVSKGSRQDDAAIPDDIDKTDDKLTELDTNKFWNFSRNVDLEDFSSQRVYKSLFDQSINVVSGLGDQKEDAKGRLYIFLQCNFLTMKFSCNEIFLQ